MHIFAIVFGALLGLGGCAWFIASIALHGNTGSFILSLFFMLLGLPVAFMGIARLKKKKLQEAAAGPNASAGHVSPADVKEAAHSGGDAHVDTGAVVRQVLEQRMNDFTGGRPLGGAPFPVYYGGGICDVCNKTLTSGEAYKVPVDVFYSSAKYKQRIAPLAMMSGMTADQMLRHMRSQDKTAHSAVCKDCISLFE